MTTSQPKVHLQGIGKVSAKAAGELRVGEVTVWNYGYTATVLSVEETVNGLWVKIKVRSDSSGVESERKMRKTTLVAMAKPAQLANNHFSDVGETK